MEGNTKITVESKSYSKDARLPVDKYPEIKDYYVKATERARDTIVLKQE